MESPEWIYAIGDKQSGPVDEEAVEQLIRSGQIGPGVMVWRQGMPEWVRASDSELARYFPVPKVAPVQGKIKTIGLIALGAVGGIIGFIGILLLIFIPDAITSITVRDKARVTKCVMAMSSVKSAVESYMDEFKDTPVLEDLYKEQLLSREKVVDACDSVSEISGSGFPDGTYTVTASPKGKFSRTCLLILTQTGINMNPQPDGCRTTNAPTIEKPRSESK
jgi:hypothetical protein